MVMQAHADGFKFSSQCLEILLKKNLIRSSQYLLNEYYPQTKIDTEIIVRSVANDIQKSQDYVIFKLKQRMLGEGKQFNTSLPVVYWAQSVEDVLISIKLHPEMDTPLCKESFERNVEITES